MRIPNLYKTTILKNEFYLQVKTLIISEIENWLKIVY